MTSALTVRARSAPDDVLKVDLAVPKCHVLVVVLCARVSNTGLGKYGIERRSWRGWCHWILRWTPFGQTDVSWRPYALYHYRGAHTCILCFKMVIVEIAFLAGWIQC